MFQKILMLLQLVQTDSVSTCLGFLGPLPNKGNLCVCVCVCASHCSCGVLSELYSVSPLSLISVQLGVREEEEH